MIAVFEVGTYSNFICIALIPFIEYIEVNSDKEIKQSRPKVRKKTKISKQYNQVPHLT